MNSEPPSLPDGRWPRGASRAGGNGNQPHAPAREPSAEALPVASLESPPLPTDTPETRRARWVAALIMAISMLITMLLFLYAGYWLYHQKKQPFSNLWPSPPRARQAPGIVSPRVSSSPSRPNRATSG